MRINKKFVLKTSLAILGVFTYCEYVVYFAVQHFCDWPTLDPDTVEPNIKSTHQSAVRALILADTHLLGSRHGHWFDKLRREWQMYRAFQTAITLHEPDIVFVLGDLTDEGLYCSSAEFEYYVKRFYSLFKVPEKTALYVVAGNHDMGFHYGISPYLNQRFVSGFNTPSVQIVSLRGNHFVLVNSMALEGDGCFLCKPAQVQLNHIEKILKCSQGEERGCSSVNKLESYSRPILLQHYPLYRNSDHDCNDTDAAPLEERQRQFRERWDCVGREASERLLSQLRPRAVLCGHTHHGCTRRLSNGMGTEYTMPSFSWRNKIDPSYGLAVFTPNNYAFSKCAMPVETTVINIYTSAGCCLVMWLIYCFFTRQFKRSIKLKLH